MQNSMTQSDIACEFYAFLKCYNRPCHRPTNRAENCKAETPASYSG